jgi:hypothetical protein
MVGIDEGDKLGKSHKNQQNILKLKISHFNRINKRCQIQRQKLKFGFYHGLKPLVLPNNHD